MPTTHPPSLSSYWALEKRKSTKLSLSASANTSSSRGCISHHNHLLVISLLVIVQLGFTIDSNTALANLSGA